MECTVSDVFDAFQLCKSIIHHHYYVHFCDPAGELLITIFGNWQVKIGKHDIEYFVIYIFHKLQAKQAFTCSNSTANGPVCLLSNP